jgi:hypothetical protein
VFNLNSDRCGGSFSIPVPDAAAVTNIGFSAPTYHDGDGNGNVNFSAAPWTTSRGSDALTFSTESQAANNNANALRWSTLYNFRFDANVAPAGVGNVKIGLWKAGSPGSAIAAAQAPGAFPAPLDGAGSATPSAAQITTSTLLKVAVTPATSPTSTGITVTASLSTLNGSSAQPFYDDGTHGDVTPGDGVFSFLAPLTEPLSAGGKLIPFTVSDAQSRSSNGSINLTLTAAPSGGCCVTGSCSVQSAYACGQAGGTYRGDGSNCGQATYTVSSAGSAFSSIAASGTPAVTPSN